MAPCEAGIVLATILYLGERLRGRQILWYVDNTVALHSLVKGTSNDPAVARTVHAVHMCAFRYGSRVWWEYVESNSNWSDGISRYGPKDVFAKRHNFVIVEMSIPEWPHVLSLEELWVSLSH